MDSCSCQTSAAPGAPGGLPWLASRWTSLRSRCVRPRPAPFRAPGTRAERSVQNAVARHPTDRAEILFKTPAQALIEELFSAIPIFAQRRVCVHLLQRNHLVVLPLVAVVWTQADDE
jgi:hypothetical protein